jgi:uncharacterized protein (TIGR00304 family)
MILLLLLGLVLIFLGFIILMQQSEHVKDDYWTDKTEKDQATQIDNEATSQFGKKTKIKGGGVVMIGPIPIVFGSDPRTALLLMAIALALMLIWLFAFL